MSVQKPWLLQLSVKEGSLSKQFSEGSRVIAINSIWVVPAIPPQGRTGGPLLPAMGKARTASLGLSLVRGTGRARTQD